jgi:hypothetical protein
MDLDAFDLLAAIEAAPEASRRRLTGAACMGPLVSS